MKVIHKPKELRCCLLYEALRMIFLCFFKQRANSWHTLYSKAVSCNVKMRHALDSITQQAFACVLHYSFLST